LNLKVVFRRNKSSVMKTAKNHSRALISLYFRSFRRIGICKSSVSRGAKYGEAKLTRYIMC